MEPDILVRVLASRSGIQGYRPLLLALPDFLEVHLYLSYFSDYLRAAEYLHDTINGLKRNRQLIHNLFMTVAAENQN